jgi:hypothetical protein
MGMGKSRIELLMTQLRKRRSALQGLFVQYLDSQNEQDLCKVNACNSLRLGKEAL